MRLLNAIKELKLARWVLSHKRFSCELVNLLRTAFKMRCIARTTKKGVPRGTPFDFLYFPTDQQSVDITFPRSISSRLAISRISSALFLPAYSSASAV